MVSIHQVYRGDYAVAADFPQPEIGVITGARVEEIGDKRESKVVITFQSNTTGKSVDIVCNKSNSELIAAAYSPETNNWMGQPLKVSQHQVMFSGKPVAGILLTPSSQQQAAPAPAAPPAGQFQPVPEAFHDDDVPF